MDIVGVSIIGYIVLLISILVYLIPAIVAERRHHPQKIAIFVLNLLLGWTFLGWVISLVWACTTTQQQLEKGSK